MSSPSSPTNPQPNSADSSPSHRGNGRRNSVAVRPAEMPPPGEAERILKRAARTAQANAKGAREPQRPKFAGLVGSPTFTLRTDEELAAAEQRQKEREEKARRIKLWELAGVPPKYREARLLKDVERVPEDAREHYREAADRLGRLLDRPVRQRGGGAIVALIGKRGPGKTHMACGLIREFCARGQSARYLHAMDYFAELKTTYDPGAPRDETQVEHTYMSPELLVLDEVHERGDTPWEDRMLTRLVVKRHDQDVITVLIANDVWGTFESRVGPSIASRMDDGGGVIECDWASLRGRV